MLYHPTSSELSSVIDSFRLQFPSLSARIDRAADILIEMELEAAADSWRVPSQSNALGSYHVDTRAGTCTCPDWPRFRTCKHLLAADGYEKTLEVNLSERLLAGTAANIRKAKLDPAHWLIRIAGTKAVTNLCRKEPIRFHTAWSKRHDCLSFASPLDAAAFSGWLRAAKPEAVTVEWERRLNDPHCLQDSVLSLFEF